MEDTSGSSELESMYATYYRTQVKKAISTNQPAQDTHSEKKVTKPEKSHGKTPSGSPAKESTSRYNQDNARGHYSNTKKNMGSIARTKYVELSDSDSDSVDDDDDDDDDGDADDADYEPESVLSSSDWDKKNVPVIDDDDEEEEESEEEGEGDHEEEEEEESIDSEDETSSVIKKQIEKGKITIKMKDRDHSLRKQARAKLMPEFGVSGESDWDSDRNTSTLNSSNSFDNESEGPTPGKKKKNLQTWPRDLKLKKCQVKLMTIKFPSNIPLEKYVVNVNVGHKDKKMQHKRSRREMNGSKVKKRERSSKSKSKKSVGMQDSSIHLIKPSDSDDDFVDSVFQMQVKRKQFGSIKNRISQAGGSKRKLAPSSMPTTSPPLKRTKVSTALSDSDSDFDRVVMPTRHGAKVLSDSDDEPEVGQSSGVTSSHLSYLSNTNRQTRVPSKVFITKKGSGHRHVTVDASSRPDYDQSVEDSDYHYQDERDSFDDNISMDSDSEDEPIPPTQFPQKRRRQTARKSMTSMPSPLFMKLKFKQDSMSSVTDSEKEVVLETSATDTEGDYSSDEERKILADKSAQAGPVSRPHYHSEEDDLFPELEEQTADNMFNDCTVMLPVSMSGSEHKSPVEDIVNQSTHIFQDRNIFEEVSSINNQSGTGQQSTVKQEPEAEGRVDVPLSQTKCYSSSDSFDIMSDSESRHVITSYKSQLKLTSEDNGQSDSEFVSLKKLNTKPDASASASSIFSMNDETPILIVGDDDDDDDYDKDYLAHLTQPSIKVEIEEEANSDDDIIFVGEERNHDVIVLDDDDHDEDYSQRMYDSWMDDDIFSQTPSMTHNCEDDRDGEGSAEVSCTVKLERSTHKPIKVEPPDGTSDQVQIVLRGDEKGVFSHSGIQQRCSNDEFRDLWSDNSDDDDKLVTAVADTESPSPLCVIAQAPPHAEIAQIRPIVRDSGVCPGPTEVEERVDKQVQLASVITQPIFKENTMRPGPTEVEEWVDVRLQQASIQVHPSTETDSDDVQVLGEVRQVSPGVLERPTHIETSIDRTLQVRRASTERKPSHAEWDRNLGDGEIEDTDDDQLLNVDLQVDNDDQLEKMLTELFGSTETTTAHTQVFEKKRNTTNQDKRFSGLSSDSESSEGDKDGAKLSAKKPRVKKSQDENQNLSAQVTKKHTMPVNVKKTSKKGSKIKEIEPQHHVPGKNRRVTSRFYSDNSTSTTISSTSTLACGETVSVGKQDGQWKFHRKRSSCAASTSAASASAALQEAEKPAHKPSLTITQAIQVARKGMQDRDRYKSGKIGH